LCLGFKLKKQKHRKSIPLDLMIPFPTLIGGGSGEDDVKKFIFFAMVFLVGCDDGSFFLLLPVLVK
jgi:hypothetical protein